MDEKIKILHLEDLSSDAHLVEREIKKGHFPYETKVVYNKENYIEAINNFKPDIILSDHSLPTFNSSEALSYIYKNNLQIPFILVTGNVSEEFAVAMIKAGAWDYILKDRMQRLPNAIISAVEKFHLHKRQQKNIDDLVANELLFKQAESIAQFGIWKFDVITGTSTWSEQTYCLLGYEPWKVTATYKNFLRNIIDEDIPKVNQAIRKAFHKSDNTDIEFGVNLKDGTIRYLRSKFIVERNKENKIVSITGFNQDVTETKLAEDFKIQSYNHKAEVFIKEQLSKTLSEKSYVLDYISENRKDKFVSIMTQALNGKN